MAAKAEVSYVQYFIPSDGDTEEHPNVFVVRVPPRALALRDVSAAFPLPGEYLFRAKIPFGKTHGASARKGAACRGRPAPSRRRALPSPPVPFRPPSSSSLPVWLDLGAPEERVPSFNTKFVLTYCQRFVD